MFDNKKIICFGTGKNFTSYVKRLEQCISIYAFGDNDSVKWGKRPYNDDRICMSPDEIANLENPFIIITLDDCDTIMKIKSQFEVMGIESIGVKEVLNNIYYQADLNWIEQRDNNNIHKFIDLNLHGTTICNFHCDYCYVWRRMGFHDSAILSEHTPSEIRKCLSKSRVGGVCFINICARGETLLTDKIVELVHELLEEGHYVSVVTNGTITQNIRLILQFPTELQSKMFFKISFHYLELKKRKLFDIFWKNVELIRNSKCSYTLEITPYDGIIDYIGDIVEMFEEKEMGALPHISFARDSTKKDYDVYTDYSLEKYREIWGQFDSKMFSLKSEWYGKKITQKCYAGKWTYLVNILTGDIKPCYAQEPIGNIYDENMKRFPSCPTESNCKMAYCFNNHAFLAWGAVPEIECYNYLDMRDRVNTLGEHWVKQPMYGFMSEKLSKNNFDYIGKWDDYIKLYKKARKKAAIIFNSPDYKNIGDHAIALAERKFLNDCLPQYDVIEIAVEQYNKEKKDILEYIKKDDLIIISGGGNIGTLWIRFEDSVLDIVNSLTNNKICIFPQSVWFEESEFGRKEKSIFEDVVSKHGDVHIALRDSESYTRLKGLLDKSVDVQLIPDMALYLKYENSYNRSGVAVCIRNDKESKGNDKEKIKAILKEEYERVDEISTIYENNIFLNQREGIVNDLLDSISRRQLVITDRLHCMIFCAITGTPCIALDNTTGKLSGTYNWIKKMPYIKMISSANELKALIPYMKEQLCEQKKMADELAYKYADWAKIVGGESVS